jgi:uncharacterized protein (DUF2132 family)
MSQHLSDQQTRLQQQRATTLTGWSLTAMFQRIVGPYTWDSLQVKCFMGALSDALRCRDRRRSHALT